MSLWRVCNILLQHLQNEFDGEEEECGQGNASGEGGTLEVGPPAYFPVDDDDDINIKGQELKAFRRSLSALGLSLVVVGFDSAMLSEICLRSELICLCADTQHLRVLRFIVRRSVLHVLLVSIQTPVLARTELSPDLNTAEARARVLPFP